MRPRKTGFLALLAVLACATGWLVARVGAEEPKPAARVHADGPAMGEALLVAFDALMRDDLEAARGAIKRLNAACNRLSREADQTFAEGFYNRDQALHKVLDGTLGYIVDGRADDAHTEFVWVTRTCRECHALARKAGLLPEAGPMWPAHAGDAKRVETTHTQRQKP